MSKNLTQTLAFKLGKLMIAIGWADGNLDHDEINAMKNMLFRLKDLNTEDWAQLEILMEQPTPKEDREKFLEDVLTSIHSTDDKKFVLENLRELIAADGTVKPEEKSLVLEIEKAVNGKLTGISGLLESFTRNVIVKSVALIRYEKQQDRDLEDYLENKILYDIKKKFPGQEIAFSPRELKKWSAGAGLLGRVAITDGEFDEKEKKVLVSILESAWGLKPEIAGVISEIVKKRVEDGHNDIHKKPHYEHLARLFYEETEYAERIRFIELLFQIANASQKTSFEEIETIRGISIDLKVGHSDFIKAKLTIPGKDRKGM